MPPESLSALLACRRPLLLQGPMGPFFAALADYLTGHGLDVSKVHFNGGDEHFYRARPASRYVDGPDGWEPWLRRLLSLRAHDAVVLFGQARWMHRVAIRVARELGLQVFVFEEGYIRPHYVTLEVDGVNGHTSLPKDVAYYRESPYPRLTRPQDAAQRFGRMAWLAVRYAVAAQLNPRYRANGHHRELGPKEAARWVRGGWRKVKFGLRERGVLEQLTSPALSKRWFLLALQVHNDAQLTEHSTYRDMAHVIDEVLTSFAVYAPDGAMLVIKHHPMDRAHRDYSGLIAQATHRLGLDGRVRYVHDLHLPTLLKHARGLVTVNSTTGLQSLYHGTPVCVLGDSMYGIPGLVHEGTLATFWHEQPTVDPVLYRRFRAHVIALTQLNASFYGRMPGLVRTAAGAPAPEEAAARVPVAAREPAGARTPAWRGYGSRLRPQMPTGAPAGAQLADAMAASPTYPGDRRRRRA